MSGGSEDFVTLLDLSGSCQGISRGLTSCSSWWNSSDGCQNSWFSQTKLPSLKISKVSTPWNTSLFWRTEGCQNAAYNLFLISLIYFVLTSLAHSSHSLFSESTAAQSETCIYLFFLRYKRGMLLLGKKKSVFIKTKQNKKMYNPFHVSITEQISEYLVQGSNNKELIQNTDYLKLLIHKDTEYFFLTTKSGIPFLRRVDLGGMTWTN